MNAVDTNVLIYAHDPRDSRKQKIAISLIESLGEGVLLWQVACEYLAASRKLEPLGYNLKSAWQDVAILRRVWHTQIPSRAVLTRAEEIVAKFGLSFWDAMIAGACVESQVDTLYTEDFGGSVNIHGLDIVNPFATDI